MPVLTAAAGNVSRYSGLRVRWSISGETNWGRIPTTTFDCRLKGLMTLPVVACLLQGYVTVFTTLKFMANDGVHVASPAPRDRQHNRRDAIANVVIDW
jgi:hypothetical protein